MSSCTYCGARNEIARDHVVPVSFTSMKRHFGTGQIVPACRECNSLLGARLICTVPERAAYLHDAIQKRHRKLLQQPDWEDEEIEELGPSMQLVVRAGIEQRELTRERLANLKLVAGH